MKSLILASALDFTKTGTTFGDWLMAAEKLNLLLTGKRVFLADMFDIRPWLLASPVFMPVFRPVGASNDDVVRWMVKVGMDLPFREVPVADYRNAEGPKVPQLFYTKCATSPDRETLGKSSDQLLLEEDTWINFYGWSWANILYSLITSFKFDSYGTATCFPDDTLPDGEMIVRSHYSRTSNRAILNRIPKDMGYPDVGGRVAISIPLRKK